LKFISTPYIYILIFLNFNLYAQELVLKPQTVNPGNQEIFNGITYKRLNSDQKEIYKQIDSIRVQLQKKGYLQNKVKNIEIKDSTYIALFQINKKIEQIVIHYTPPLPEVILHLVSKKNNEAYFEIPFDQKIPRALQELKSLADMDEYKGIIRKLLEQITTLAP